MNHGNVCFFFISRRFYAIIVVDTRQAQREFTDDPPLDFMVNPPDQSRFDDARRFDDTVRQPYYITAAWSDPSLVPPSFVIGDETTTEVNGITYENGPLRQGTQYAIFYRVETVSDNAEVMWVAVIYIFT